MHGGPILNETWDGAILDFAFVAACRSLKIAEDALGKRIVGSGSVLKSQKRRKSSSGGQVGEGGMYI
jgi:hypothetical protein